MRQGIFRVVLPANVAALVAVFNPWFEDWAGSGTVFFVFEGVFLLFIGVPVFIHHVRKGMSPREAEAASLDSVM